MQWLKNYQLFLFDLDGLLVNTEHLHYQAYQTMCRNRGFELPWNMEKYCTVAHYHDELKGHIYADIPALQAQEPDWKVLYQEKKRAFLDLVAQGGVQLMPGVEQLLTELHAQGIRRAVVTHSLLELVDSIREKLPLLNTIPHWITREHYTKAKPSPECYLTAVRLLGQPGDRIIGFEDTPRGMTALSQAPVDAVWISDIPYPEIPQFAARGVRHFPRFTAIPATL